MLLLGLSMMLQAASAGPSQKPPIEQVEIAPVFYKAFACIDHPEGQLEDLGDGPSTGLR
jgi:hypothetical protein